MSGDPVHGPYPLQYSLGDKSVLFRTMLKQAADMLTPEDVESLAYIHSVQKAARGEAAALNLFKELEAKGVFSADNVEPLEELLRGINRHDIANTVVKEFKVKLRGVRRSGSDSQLSQRFDWQRKKTHVSMDSDTSSSHHLTLTPHTLPPHTTSILHSEVPSQQQSPPSLCPSESLSLVGMSIAASQQQKHIDWRSKKTYIFMDSGTSSCHHNLPPHTTSRRDSEVTYQQQHQICLFPTDLTAVHPVHSCSMQRFMSCPRDRTITTWNEHRRMEWSVDRYDLEQRIVGHSNVAFAKGSFSLTADSIKSRIRKPVSLVFKLYPYGIGKDENQSLTLEVVVECPFPDLRTLGMLNVTTTVSINQSREFISSKTHLLLYSFIP